MGGGAGTRELIPQTVRPTAAVERQPIRRKRRREKVGVDGALSAPETGSFIEPAPLRALLGGRSAFGPSPWLLASSIGRG